VHRLHLRQATEADAEIHAHALGDERRANGVQARIRIGLDRRGRTEMGETTELFHVLGRERLRERLR
jgi:hypothetical protein